MRRFGSNRCREGAPAPLGASANPTERGGAPQLAALALACTAVALAAVFVLAAFALPADCAADVFEGDRHLLSTTLKRSDVSKAVGLSFDDPCTEGCILDDTSSIQTVSCPFALDCVFVSEEGRVVAVETVEPGRPCVSYAGTSWVLELQAGCASACGIEVGDILLFRET